MSGNIAVPTRRGRLGAQADCVVAIAPAVGRNGLPKRGRQIMATSPSSNSRSPASTKSGYWPEIRAFLVHLASERRLATNWLLAYRRDLENLEGYLVERGHTPLSARR